MSSNPDSQAWAEGPWGPYKLGAHAPDPENCSYCESRTREDPMFPIVTIELSHVSAYEVQVTT